jgi:hypothetical protein
MYSYSAHRNPALVGQGRAAMRLRLMAAMKFPAMSRRHPADSGHIRAVRMLDLGSDKDRQIRGETTREEAPLPPAAPVTSTTGTAAFVSPFFGNRVAPVDHETLPGHVGRPR